MYDESLVGKSENIMDQWILSYSQSLIKSVKEEMETYHLNRVVPKLLKFVEQLTNWYVRFNRKRLKGETGDEDCVHALTTLYTGEQQMSLAGFSIDDFQRTILKPLNSGFEIPG